MRTIDADAVEDYLYDYVDPYEIQGVLYAIDKMPTIEPEITKDGTLLVNVQDASMVGRVLVVDNKNVGGLYYLSDEGSNIIHCKDRQYWKRLITDAHKCSILRWLTKPEDFCSFCAKERRQ